MHRKWLIVMVALLSACGREGGAGAASEALTADRWQTAPSWTQTAAVIARRGGLTLVRGERPTPLPDTDVRPAVPMAVLRDDGAALLPHTEVVEGALLDGAVAWVDLLGTLVIDDGAQARSIDDDVIGELAVDPSGQKLAYAKRPGDDAGVWLHVSGEARPRRLTVGLAVADRPLFVDAEHLVVVGAAPGGVAGVWVVGHAGVDPQPRPITNAELRAGQPFGSRFVPPPAYHESMRLDGDDLVYHDGAGERRVSLGEALR